MKSWAIAGGGDIWYDPPSIVSRTGIRAVGSGSHQDKPIAVATLALLALGVVFGDIGTSPLYTIKECVALPHGVPPTHENILGILSLIFWSLTFVIMVKYATFIMRADNEGEGGILALLALIAPRNGDSQGKLKGRMVLVLAGLFGAALLYGDGMITPVITVLSAVEGLEVATVALSPYVVPITVVIIVALFTVQKRGTAGVGKIFGPILIVWFACIGAAGLPQILKHPVVLGAINPLHAVTFFAHHHLHGFLVLGSVVLCITGGEALYADLGHFGRRAIQVAWYSIVFPALLLNYFGQGALLLSNPAAAGNPFYGLVPGYLLYPMVLISTIASIIASQALISGAFSLTRQAVQLGYCPRVSIIHTSGQTEGQIYVPEVNAILMVSCVALALAFRKSSNLAAAYGVAVTGTMTITSLLFYYVARHRWKWSRWTAGGLLAVFLFFDLSFFFANAVKIGSGGWFPLVVAVAVFAIMTTWKRGRTILRDDIQKATLPLPLFLQDIESVRPPRVSGTAVFLTSNPQGTPPVLLHHFKHNKVLHEQVVLLCIVTDRVPEVGSDKRVDVIRHPHGVWQITAHYGFMQTPNVPYLLRLCEDKGLRTSPNDTSYYLGRENLIVTRRRGMVPWRKTLFSYLSRNAVSATAFFRIPVNRVVEIGAQIEL